MLRVSSADRDRALAHLIAKLDAPDAPADDSGDEGYAALRAAFIDAGMRRVRELSVVPEWLQINVRLDPDRRHLERFMARDPAATFASWLAGSELEHVWFVRKDDGFRWRFIGVPPHLRAAIRGFFTGLVQENAVAAWNETRYDPETYQFGGTAGLELTHRLFTHDTLALLRYRASENAAAGGVADDVFSLLLLDALLRRCVGDEWELWDVWCRMTATGRLPLGPCGGDRAFREAAAEVRRQLLPSLREPKLAERAFSPVQRAVYAEFAERAAEVAAEAVRLADAGRLLWGLRDVLPFWIIFHWNRFGFDVARQRRLALLMTHVLDPKRGPEP